MKLRDISIKDPITVTETTPIWQAALAMSENGCGFLPVTRLGMPVGVVTGRDMATRILARRLNFDTAPVSAIMSSPVVSLDSEADAEEALLLMRQMDIHRLVVTEANGLMRSVVTLADLAGNASDESIARNLRRHVEQASVRPNLEFVATIQGVYLG